MDGNTRKRERSVQQKRVRTMEESRTAATRWVNKWNEIVFRDVLKFVKYWSNIPEMVSRWRGGIAPLAGPFFSKSRTISVKSILSPSLHTTTTAKHTPNHPHIHTPQSFKVRMVVITEHGSLGTSVSAWGWKNAIVAKISCARRAHSGWKPGWRTGRRSTPSHGESVTQRETPAGRFSEEVRISGKCLILVQIHKSSHNQRWFSARHGFRIRRTVSLVHPNLGS